MKKPSRVGRRAWRRLCAASDAFARVLSGNEYASRSYAQYGEDMVLKAVFARYPDNYPGCSVDVGAHHPMRFSNTCFFYERDGPESVSIPCQEPRGSLRDGDRKMSSCRRASLKRKGR